MLELWAVLVYAPAQGGAQAELPRVSAALKHALEASGAEVVEHAIAQAKSDAAAGWRPKSALAFFADARQAIDDGRRALERVALEQAQAAFERGEKALDAHRAEPAAATLEATAALGRGVALYELGRADEATRAFARAKALEPALELTEATVRPDVARAFRAATPEALASAPSTAPDNAAIESLRARPELASLDALAAVLGLDGILVAAAGHDHGELALVAARAHGGCTSGLAESRAAIDQAAARLVDKLRAAPCAEKPADPLAAQAIAHPRPPPAPVEFRPAPKKLRVWERPWLWAGLLAGTSLIVGLSAGLAPHGTTTSATLDASRFAH